MSHKHYCDYCKTEIVGTLYVFEGKANSYTGYCHGSWDFHLELCGECARNLAQSTGIFIP